MIKTAAFALAATLMAVASPAFADVAKPMPDGAVQPTEVSTAPSKPAADKKYCIKQEITGSQLTLRRCLTRGQWEARGVNPAGK